VNVLHLIATGQRRGAEVFAADLVAALDARDLDQRVAVLHGSPPWAVELRVPVAGLRAGASRRQALPLEPGAVLGLRRLLRDWRPDLVQAHGGQPLKYAAAATVGGGPPLVYRRIGSVSWLSNRPRTALYGRLVRRADRVVAVAEAVRQETIEAFGVPPARVVTIPNGVDPWRVEPLRGREASRVALGVAAGSPVVLSLGALAWEKDPLGHLAVTAPLLRRHAGAAHLFAGDGPLRPQLEAAARHEGLEGRVKVLGSRTDVGDLLAASDLMLFASRTEGMPASVIEAGLSGLPVVGFGLVGVPEVVDDGVSGLLAPPGDHDGLRAATARLFEDVALRARLGQAARARCRERYAIQVVASAYRELYEDVIEAACATS
jgi:glycosyltransferase involved in cell wall biosynthesis